MRSQGQSHTQENRIDENIQSTAQTMILFEPSENEGQPKAKERVNELSYGAPWHWSPC